MTYKRLSIVLLAIAVVSCGKDVDRGECLESHRKSSWIQYIPLTTCTGTSCFTRMQMIVHPAATICDEWQYPNGKLGDDPKP